VQTVGDDFNNDDYASAESDASSASSDADQALSDVKTLMNEATDPTDQMRLKMAAVGLAAFEIGFNDLPNGDVTDYLSAAQSGSSVVTAANGGLGTLHICEGS